MGQYYIEHSAKGSQWKKHKYIKIMNGLYFYPDDYVGGRHLSSAKSSSKKKKDSKDDSKKGSSSSKDKDGKKKGMSSKRIEKLAQKAIRGDYGNGQDRINKLGKKYNKVQHRVNQILLGDAGATRVWNRDHPGKSEPGTAKKKKTTTKKTTTKKSTTKKK